MRRTYRSKKETGGGLDPRDAVLAMDEKASAFDAFYIQNIKQTKRDLSVGTSMFAASNKVRKRKYVKRLKDQEPIIGGTRESMTRSGCLTPDKSIHLKRALDPFDLLLNSPSTNEVSSKPVNNVFSPLHTRGKGKRDKKKALRKKKFNYLSSDKTASDKENSYNSSKNHKTQDDTDILSHELEIEKEEKITSHNIDESIINIVTNLSLLDKIQNLSSASPLSSTMKDKLSISPGQKSPICSTPFQKKYRGKSIYKFSPISAYVDDSKHYTNTENLKESIEYKNEVKSVPNSTLQSTSLNKKSVNYDNISSPILPCRNVTDKNRTKEMIKNYHPITKEISLLQTSEQEPFLGFPISNSSSVQKLNLEAVVEMKEKTIEDLKQSQFLDFTITNGENRNSIVNNKNNNQYSSQKHGNDASFNADTTRENQLAVAKSLERLHSPELTREKSYGPKISFNSNESREEINLEDTTHENNETGQGSVIKETSSQTHSEENSVDYEHTLNEENTLEPSQIYYVKSSTIVKQEDSLKEKITSELNQTHSEENCVDHEHSLNEENNFEPSQIYSVKSSVMVAKEDGSKEENTSEPGPTFLEKYSIGTNEHSLNDETTLEPRQTYAEKYSIGTKYEHSLNDETTLEPRQTYAEKYSIGTNEHSLNDETTLGPRQTYAEKYSIGTNEHSLNDETTLEPRQTYAEKYSIGTNEHSLNDENTLEPRQTYAEKYSIDTNADSLNDENTLETRHTYSEENSIIEIEHNISVEESTSGEEIEQTISEPYQTHSEENNTAENEHSFIEEGTCNNSIDTDSLYESCYSENEKSDIGTDNKELLVVIEGLSDSVFNKYNKEATLSESSQSDKSNDESCSSDNTSNRYTSLDENYALSKSTKSTSDEDVENDLQEGTLMNISNNDQDDDENNKPDDDVFVSFVTRRRRNEITKNSFILFFENSLTSTGSNDFNKTVLSNNKPSVDSLQGNNDITIINDAQENTDGDISLLQNENTIIETESSPLPKIKRTGVASKSSAVISRKSSNLSTDNINTESNTEINDCAPRNRKSKKSSILTRKSSKLSTDKINSESIDKGNNDTSRNSFTSSTITTRKSSRMYKESVNTKPTAQNLAPPECVNQSYNVVNDNMFDIKQGIVLEPGKTRKSSRMYKESVNTKPTAQNLAPPECVTQSYNTVNDMSEIKQGIVLEPGRTRKSSRKYKESVNTKPAAQNLAPPECVNQSYNIVNDMSEIKQGIVLEPGKRWERSLSIYRRVTTMGDHFDQTMLDDEQLTNKGRKYRQSVINTMEMQDISVSLHNESVKSRRSTLFSKPSRSTIKILRESNACRISLSSTSVSDDLGFLSEDCDDTLVELSKLSIIDSDHEVTVLDKFNDTSNRITTARDYVLRRCNQTDVIQFDECYPDTVLKNCRKIGEGVYGEVFLWRAGDGRARVLKVVPIAGHTKVNGENQKDYHEVISEIVIAMELSALRAPIIEIEKHLDEGQGAETLDLHSVENATDVFNEVLAVRCVYGSYPSRLLDLWELYDECKGSENDNPAILPVDQQFMVLELANAGQDLESYQFHNAEQAYALFKQVAFGLAVGEEAFQFEHRDLHWGNVLIAPTDQKYATFVLRGRTHRVARRGVAATIIDYSLSRLSLRLPSDTAALYNDLAADDGLFDAVGDYQFQVYRLMRDKLGNDWKNFEPYTNILWLHYTVDKMITALRYTRTNTKIHKHYIAKLKEIKNRILDYGSVVQYVLTDNEL
ncbi:uncharacterized protein MAL13P1.304 isoform X3 [Maniola jurtina]|uniref:uncharacterized protein MAL13P1.304 isoform X3 n=1 Tax=Maniola jurtina TaxID=191418 RepID=UPI001E68CFF8|nr:uncharacterized protein MAL13P1.304 isoform X3 [Maniola jurtina]